MPFQFVNLHFIIINVSAWIENNHTYQGKLWITEMENEKYFPIAGQC